MKPYQGLIKVILIILFLVCLLRMPYGYFQFVRFAGLLGFTLLAYGAWERKQNAEVIVYVMLALLFQPFFKVILGRTIWNVVDLVVAIGLIVSLFVPAKGSKR